MFFLVYQLGSVCVGKVGGVPKDAPLLKFTTLVEGNSPEEVAKKLGVEYDEKRKDLFAPTSILEEIPGTGRWIWRRGNVQVEIYLSADPYRPCGLALGIKQIELFSERVAQMV